MNPLISFLSLSVYSPLSSLSLSVNPLLSSHSLSLYTYMYTYSFPLLSIYSFSLFLSICIPPPFLSLPL